MPIQNSPGSKPGTSVLCGRVHICGLSRLEHLQKFANTVKVKISTNSSFRIRPFEVCFHRWVINSMVPVSCLYARLIMLSMNDLWRIYPCLIAYLLLFWRSSLCVGIFNFVLFQHFKCSVWRNFWALIMKLSQSSWKICKCRPVFDYMSSFDLLFSKFEHSAVLCYLMCSSVLAINWVMSFPIM